jgi:hypothetical protein
MPRDLEMKLVDVEIEDAVIRNERKRPALAVDF